MTDQKTHYEGTQWKVTDDGIEQRGGNYFIRAEDLNQKMGDGGWIEHMAAKDWVDVDDFSKAFVVAGRVLGT